MNIMPDSNVWGNKQQLEGAVLNKGDYDLERLTETQWDNSLVLKRQDAVCMGKAEQRKSRGVKYVT